MKNDSLQRRWMLSVGILAAIVMFIGTDLVWGYLQGVRGLLQQELRDASTIKMDLARLDQQIEALRPQLAANRQKLIAGQIQIEEFAAETSRLQKHQEVAMAEMKELRIALDSGSDHLTIDGESYSRQTVEADLSRRTKSHQKTQERLKGRKQMLMRREQALEHLDQRIRQDEWEVIQLSDLADDLNERLRAIEIAEKTGDLEYTRTESTRVREFAADIDLELQGRARFQEQSEKLAMAHRVQVNLDRRKAAAQFDEYAASIDE